MLAKQRAIYGNSKPLQIQITYLRPQKTQFLQILSFCFHFKIFILPDIGAKRITSVILRCFHFKNFDQTDRAWQDLGMGARLVS